MEKQDDELMIWDLENLLEDGWEEQSTNSENPIAPVENPSTSTGNQIEIEKNRGDPSSSSHPPTTTTQELEKHKSADMGAVPSFRGKRRKLRAKKEQNFALR
jgi:hypothetical protein